MGERGRVLTVCSRKRGIEGENKGRKKVTYMDPVDARQLVQPTKTQSQFVKRETREKVLSGEERGERGD